MCPECEANCKIFHESNLRLAQEAVDALAKVNDLEIKLRLAEIDLASQRNQVRALEDLLAKVKYPPVH